MSLEISTILAEIKTGRVPANGQNIFQKCVVQAQLFGKIWKTMIKVLHTYWDLLGLSQDGDSPKLPTAPNSQAFLLVGPEYLD